MAIPSIQPYPMPSAAQVPESVASWRPDPGRAAVLVHDMQNYFLDFFPPGQAPRDLTGNVALLAIAPPPAAIIYSPSPRR
jgi:bifunctional isochorismate lyase/aryl carrier protein